MARALNNNPSVLRGLQQCNCDSTLIAAMSEDFMSKGRIDSTFIRIVKPRLEKPTSCCPHEFSFHSVHRVTIQKLEKSTLHHGYPDEISPHHLGLPGSEARLPSQSRQDQNNDTDATSC